MQMEYGTTYALSPQQRDRHLALREAAIRDALGPKRYQDYMVLKDPVYLRARQTALQYGGSTRAIMPIYQLMKTNDVRRQRVLNDTTLTREQKDDEGRSINAEQMTEVQRIIAETRIPK